MSNLKTIVPNDYFNWWPIYCLNISPLHFTEVVWNRSYNLQQLNHTNIHFSVKGTSDLSNQKVADIFSDSSVISSVQHKNGFLIQIDTVTVVTVADEKPTEAEFFPMCTSFATLRLNFYQSPSAQFHLELHYLFG